MAEVQTSQLIWKLSSQWNEQRRKSIEKSDKHDERLRLANFLNFLRKMHRDGIILVSTNFRDLKERLRDWRSGDRWLVTGSSSMGWSDHMNDLKKKKSFRCLLNSIYDQASGLHSIYLFLLLIPQLNWGKRVKTWGMSSGEQIENPMCQIADDVFVLFLTTLTHENLMAFPIISLSISS